MAGTWGKVLRNVSAVAVVALVAAGCGGASRPHETSAGGVPRALAHAWEAQASAIAAAAATGDGCRAHALATALRTDVIHAGSRVPSRLRMPLLDGVNSLADRIVCTPPPQTVTRPASPKKPKPPAHDDHGHHDHHGHGHDKGDKG
ncbi:MAG TPA: hypothetical protein VFU64_01665 [Gaiellaceae bacterium]|nr:hypothetical protein [Gaiellaceae bacterium]